jgi:hypothetical protein
MRPAALGSEGGSSRPAKVAPSKGGRKVLTAAPAPPSTGPNFDDESSAGDDDDDDDSEGSAELPELEFEEDRQRTTGVAMWEDDEGEEDDGSSVNGNGASELDDDEDEDDDEVDVDEAPRLSASVKGKGRDREMVSSSAAHLVSPFDELVLTTRPRPHRRLASRRVSRSTGTEESGRYIGTLLIPDSSRCAVQRCAPCRSLPS